MFGNHILETGYLLLPAAQSSVAAPAQKVTAAAFTGRRRRKLVFKCIISGAYSALVWGFFPRQGQSSGACGAALGVVRSERGERALPSSGPGGSWTSHAASAGGTGTSRRPSRPGLLHARYLRPGLVTMC